MEILEKDLQKIMSTPLFCGTDKKRLLQIFAEEGGEVRSFSAGELLLSPDTTEKTAVVDWYYKKGGRLHYCKFAGSTVLFAT